MPYFSDRCGFVAVSAGTGDFVVSVTAFPGFQSPITARAINGRAYNYSAQTTDLAQWETGEGLWSSGSSTLQRTTIFTNSLGTGIEQGGAGTKINFSTAPKVMLTILSDDLRFILTDNNLIVYVAKFSGTIAGGTLYTAGEYDGVALTGGTGTGATADIKVAGGAVTLVRIVSTGNNAYIIGDVLSATAASVGGTGSGFTFTITAIGNDTTGNGSQILPFATPDAALVWLSGSVEFGAGNFLTIQFSDGVYIPAVAGNAWNQNTVGGPVGAGLINVIGNLSDATGVIFQNESTTALIWNNGSMSHTVDMEFSSVTFRADNADVVQCGDGGVTGFDTGTTITTTARGGLAAILMGLNSSVGIDSCKWGGTWTQSMIYGFQPGIARFTGTQTFLASATFTWGICFLREGAIAQWTPSSVSGSFTGPNCVLLAGGFFNRGGAVATPLGGLPGSQPSTIWEGSQVEWLEAFGGSPTIHERMLDAPIAALGVTLVNGLNSNVQMFINSRITGPSAGFSLGGMTVSGDNPTAETDGMIVRAYNASGQQMTIVNEDASSTAGYRITTLTGANVVLRAGSSFASFIYDGGASRWILMGTN